MTINLFPTRVPIGRVQLPNNQQSVQMTGQALDVLMTPEFARALADVFNRIGGNSGVSMDDFALLDAFSGQVPQVVDQVGIAAQIAPADQSAQIASMQAQIEALRADLASVQSYATLGQQVEDLRVLIGMAEDPAAAVRLLLARDAPVDSSMFGDAARPVVTKNIATGSRAGNVALASLLTALASSGFITDSTTP